MEGTFVGETVGLDDGIVEMVGALEGDSVGAADKLGTREGYSTEKCIL